MVKRTKESVSKAYYSSLPAKAGSNVTELAGYSSEMRYKDLRQIMAMCMVCTWKPTGMLVIQVGGQKQHAQRRASVRAQVVWYCLTSMIFKHKLLPTSARIYASTKTSGSCHRSQRGPDEWSEHDT
jgi:hypothetical protein